MSKKKKRRPTQKVTFQKETTVTTKEERNIKQTIFSIAKFIGCMILVYIIMFGCFTVYTYFETENHGYETSDMVVKEYMSAIINNKYTRIKKCLYSHSTTYLTTSDENRQYAAIIEEMNPTIFIEDMEIQTGQYDGINIIQSKIKTDDIITEAITNTVYIPYEEVIDNDKFAGLLQYIVVTYKIEDKWYAFDMKQTGAITKLAEGNEYNIISNEVLGNISINTSWSETSIEPFENTEYAVAFENPDSTAVISLQAISSELSMNEFIDEFKNNLQINNINCTQETVTINNREMQYIYYMLIDENEKRTYQCTWFFSDPMRDGYIHCITFDSTDAGMYAKSYIDSYVY